MFHTFSFCLHPPSLSTPVLAGASSFMENKIIRGNSFTDPSRMPPASQSCHKLKNCPCSYLIGASGSINLIPNSEVHVFSSALSLSRRLKIWHLHMDVQRADQGLRREAQRHTGLTIAGVSHEGGCPGRKKTHPQLVRKATAEVGRLVRGESQERSLRPGGRFPTKHLRRESLQKGLRMGGSEGPSTSALSRLCLWLPFGLGDDPPLRA